MTPTPPRLVVDWFTWKAEPWWKRALLTLIGRGFWRTHLEHGPLAVWATLARYYGDIFAAGDGPGSRHIVPFLEHQ